MPGLRRLLAAALAAVALTAASAAGSSAVERQAGPSADGPSVISLDSYVAFKRGAALRGTGAKGARVAATYGWRASDPQGICSQDLVLEALVPDIFYEWSNLSGSARSVTFSARVGGSTLEPYSSDSTYQVFLDVTDCAGNWTGEDGTYFETGIRQEDAASYSAGWTSGRCDCYSGQGVSKTTTPGATATFTFSGRSIGVVMPKAPDRGTVRILVDGVQRNRIDLAGPTRNRVVVASYVLPDDGPHTVKIVSAGTRQVDVDAFIVS
jgi:hypothetical protein